MIEQKNCFGYLPEGRVSIFHSDNLKFSTKMLKTAKIPWIFLKWNHFQVMFQRIQIADLSLQNKRAASLSGKKHHGASNIKIAPLGLEWQQPA